MARKAKCKICGTELSKDRYSPNGKAPYYCSEVEYLSVYKNTDKDELYALIQQIFPFCLLIYSHLLISLTLLQLLILFNNSTLIVTGKQIGRAHV